VSALGAPKGLGGKRAKRAAKSTRPPAFGKSFAHRPGRPRNAPPQPIRVDL